MEFRSSVNDDSITLYVTEGIHLGSAELSRVDTKQVIDTIDFEVVDSDIWFYFNRLFVATPIRNRGIATFLMGKLIEIVDSKCFNIIIDVNPYGDLNLWKLNEFYCKFGFVSVEQKTLARRCLKLGA